MGKKESIEDTAKVLGRYYDGLQYRGSSQELVEQLAHLRESLYTMDLQMRTIQHKS